MVIIPRQPWRTMVSSAVFSLGCELKNCITVHRASDVVDSVTQICVFDVASAMAALVVTPLL